MKFKIYIVVLFFTFFLIPVAFSLEYTFHPRFSATQEYTSNRDLTDNNQEDDFISIISAGFTAQMLAKTSGLEVSYDPAYSIYYDSSGDNQLRHDANLLGWAAPSKNTTFEFNNNFFLTEDPRRDEGIIVSEEGIVEEPGDTTIRKGRQTYYRNTANANLTYNFGLNKSVYADFLYGILRNNDSQIEDNDEYSTSLGIKYWFGSKFGIQSSATYTRGLFDQDSDFIGEGSSDFNNYAGNIELIRNISTRTSLFVQYNHIYRDFDDNDSNDYMVYAPSAGFQYMIEKDLNLRLGAGYFYQEVNNEDDEQGIFGNGQIDKTWLYRRGSINLVGLTGLAQNDFGAQNVGLERYAAVQAAANYLFTRRISGDINTYYRYSDVVGNADQDANDDTGEGVHRLGAGAGLTFNPLNWMYIQLSYNYNRVYSENKTDEYEEHRGLLTITLTPSQPFRYVD